jgi:hypothetical protein
MELEKKKPETLRDKIISHKKSCLCVIGLVFLVIILIIVWAHTYPVEKDTMISKIKSQWKKGGGKERDEARVPKRARSKGDGSRSDSTPGGDTKKKNKKEFLKTVEQFNKIANVPDQ